MTRFLYCSHCECMVSAATFNLDASRCKPCANVEHALYRYWREVKGTPLGATRGRVSTWSGGLGGGVA